MYTKGDTLEHFVYSLELDSQHDKKIKLGFRDTFFTL